MFEASDELRASSHFEHCCPIIRANASYLSCVVETICWRKQIRTACFYRCGAFRFQRRRSASRVGSPGESKSLGGSGPTMRTPLCFLPIIHHTSWQARRNEGDLYHFFMTLHFFFLKISHYFYRGF